MFIKVLLLLSLESVLGARQKVTPDDLQDDLKTVERKLKEDLLNAVLKIRTALVIIEVVADDAKEDFVADLKSASKDYWKSINSLQSIAGDQGQDISECVALGNKQLYNLNKQLTLTMHHNIDDLVLEGKEEAEQNLADARSVLPRFNKISDKIEACGDVMCATILKDELLDIYINCLDTVEAARDAMVEYRDTYLSQSLRKHRLDKYTYKETYLPFVRNVTTCIMNESFMM